MLLKPRVDSQFARLPMFDRRIEEPPVGNERWFGVTNLSQPLSSSLGLTEWPLNFPRAQRIR